MDLGDDGHCVTGAVATGGSQRWRPLAKLAQKHPSGAAGVVDAAEPHLLVRRGLGLSHYLGVESQPGREDCVAREPSLGAGGFDATEGYSDELLDDLVVSGDESEVAETLGSWREAGVGEVLAHPLFEPDNREPALKSAFAAVARAAGA